MASKKSFIPFIDSNCKTLYKDSLGHGKEALLYDVTYNAGHGHLTINVDTFFPCTRQDFYRLLSAVEMADDEQGKAAELYGLLSGLAGVIQNLINRDKLEKGDPYEKDSAELLKRYASLANIVAKKYGFAEVSTGAETVKMKSAIVYSVKRESTLEYKVEQLTGWTFEKGGYRFDVYKDKVGRFVEYVVMLYGVQVVTVKAKNDAPAAIDKRVLDLLEKNAEKLKEFEKRYNELMIKAGYREAEPAQRPQTISTDEAKQLPAVIQAVQPMAKVEAVEPQEAAGTPAVAASEEVATDSAKTAQEAAQQARNPKAARGPVPEKHFVGESITGKGWRILFDGKAQRTRVIFEGKPSSAARAAVEQAGFYYSPHMKSWNKKLTFKAYRAAQAVSSALSAIYAA